MQNDESMADTIENDLPDGGMDDADAIADQQSDSESAAEAEAAPSTEETNMEQELEAAKARAEENWNKVLRLKAEQENLRKRSQRDIENAHKYALEKFATALLPVVDSLEMGLAAARESDDAEKLREGSELTLKMFLDVLEKFGIEQVDPTGEKFDPELHQAMSTQENPDAEPNTVLMTMQKGYLLNGRLLRPAMVIVAKG